MRQTPFQDRSDAGRQLAASLGRVAAHGGLLGETRGELLVLALPRGGVPVGFEVARALGAALDVFVVRKLGLPSQPELALGAIASGGLIVLNEDLAGLLEDAPGLLEEIAAIEAPEVERRERAYRGNRPPLDPAGRTLVLVDDGMATGATMRAAVRALRLRNPARIIAAVPVASRPACRQLRPEVDQLVCLVAEEDFRSVGQWYANFSQTSDQEVRSLLARAASGHGSAPEPAQQWGP